MTLTTEESKRINEVPPPKIIVAGSGMSHGGRILHHEFRYLRDPKSTILFVGYQTAGSLGRKILDGAKVVKIFKEEVPVRCAVRRISSYSAHADQPQLLSWLAPMRFTLARVFVVQGEEREFVPFIQKIKDELALMAEAPAAGRSLVL
jgi:metallo-beta-lactamase family protein